MRIILFCLLTVGTPIQGCLDQIFNPPTPCTMLFAYGVSVTLTDDTTGQNISNATLTLQDGAYSEVMQSFPDGSYVGAGERAGTYTLTAQAEGYQTKVIEDIIVTADECHVRGVHLDVKLTQVP